VFYYNTLCVDGEAPRILNTNIELSSDSQPIIKVEREEVTLSERLTLELIIIPQIAGVLITHTSPTVVSIMMKKLAQLHTVSNAKI